MLDIAQGHVRRVTTKEGVSDNSPRWSPDSAHLIFLSSRSGSSQVPSLDLTHKLVSLSLSALRALIVHLGLAGLGRAGRRRRGRRLPADRPAAGRGEPALVAHRFVFVTLARSQD
jgi:hypothetical protein